MLAPLRPPVPRPPTHHGLEVLGTVVVCARGSAPGPPLGHALSAGAMKGEPGPPALEVSTVADDEVVAHVPGRPAMVLTLGGLPPDTEVDLAPLLRQAPPGTEVREGLRAVRTLPRPPGPFLARVATVNDLHFGEVEAGAYGGDPPVEGVRVEAGEAPYPETMSRGAAEEVEACRPDAVVANGDLTAAGRPSEVDAFRSCWQARFGVRLHWVPGNHDVATGPCQGPPTKEVRLPGLTLALLDTTIPGRPTGALSAEQVEWLDELGSRSETPVLVLGHHHPWSPAYGSRPAGYFGIKPDDSEALVEVVARRPAIIGYASGHTHRNRVRRFPGTGEVPWAEVAALKDYPGTWVEYRVYEGGVLHVHRRVSTSAALDWSERCRAMLNGWYPTYAFGGLADRCFPLWPRRHPCHH